jgi:DNA-binding transcriptional LysR family regulator
MQMIHLARVDLNLLVVFDALIAEGHATRAAGRIGLTQPAVSHALNRLRGLFGDPLFVRSPRGMLPTPLAQEIAPSVRSILEQVEGVLGGAAPSIRPRAPGNSSLGCRIMRPLCFSRG